jgi:hypothetical protein
MSMIIHGFLDLHQNRFPSIIETGWPFKKADSNLVTLRLDSSSEGIADY